MLKRRVRLDCSSCKETKRERNTYQIKGSGSSGFFFFWGGALVEMPMFDVTSLCRNFEMGLTMKFVGEASEGWMKKSVDERLDKMNACGR
jgi:hypothetical protein